MGRAIIKGGSPTVPFRIALFHPFVDGWQARSWSPEECKTNAATFVSRVTYMAVVASSPRSAEKLICIPTGKAFRSDRDRLRELKNTIITHWNTIRHATDWKKLIVDPALAAEYELLVNGPVGETQPAEAVKNVPKRGGPDKKRVRRNPPRNAKRRKIDAIAIE
jgi:hypothetical protein